MKDFGLTVDVFYLETREDACHETETSRSEQCFVSAGPSSFYNSSFWVELSVSIEFESMKYVFGRGLGVGVGEGENLTHGNIESGSNSVTVASIFLDFV